MPWNKVRQPDGGVCVIDKRGNTVKCYYGNNAGMRANKLVSALYASENKELRSAMTVHKSELIERSDYDYDESVMVALFVPYPLNRKIALKVVGEPEADLHVTLAYLGKKSDIGENRMNELDIVVSEFARSNESVLAGAINGIGTFFGSECDSVLWLSVDIPELTAFRQGLVEVLNVAGFRVNMEHGFMPHITLAYFEDSTKAVVDEFFEPIAVNTNIEAIPIVFDEITLAWGDSRINYPLHPEAMLGLGDR